MTPAVQLKRTVALAGKVPAYARVMAPVVVFGGSSTRVAYGFGTDLVFPGNGLGVDAQVDLSAWKATVGTLSGDVRATVTDGQVGLVSGSGSVLVPVSLGEIGPMSGLDGAWRVSIRRDDVADLVAHASGDRARPILTAVRVGAECAATDSYRLVVTPGHGSEAGERSALVPAWAMALALGALPKGTELLTVTVDARSTVCVVDAGTVAVHTRCEDGEFPPYHRLLRSESPHELVFANAAAVRAWLTGLPKVKTAESVSIAGHADGVELVWCSDDMPTLRLVTPGAYPPFIPVSVNPRFFAVTLGQTVGRVGVGMVDVLKPVVVVDGPVSRLLMPVRNPSVEQGSRRVPPIEPKAPAVPKVSLNRSCSVTRPGKIGTAPVPAPVVASPVNLSRTVTRPGKIGAPVPIPVTVPAPVVEAVATSAPVNVPMPAPAVEYLARLVFPVKRTYAERLLVALVTGGPVPVAPDGDWVSKCENKCRKLVSA